MGKRVGSMVGVVAMSLLAACSAFGEADAEKQPEGTGPGRPADDPRRDAPPPPDATPPPSEITEKFGYFVTERGNDDSGEGTRAKPFATLAKALSKAKVDGKRVYVCAGKYIESLTLEDGVSMIGGYDCSQTDWSMSAKKSRVESPTSPALRAKNIKTVTRFEGFDVLAPDATEPSGSSIGLIAEGSDKLTIVSSRITAGTAAAGKSGTEGTQLVQTGAIDGQPGLGEAIWCRSFDGSCPNLGNVPKADNAPAGGVSVCSGAAGFNGGSGGAGGHGGMYYSRQVSGLIHEWQTIQGASLSVFKSGADGATGADGAPTPGLGTLSPAGFVAANGEQGKNGTPGEGGRGADGVGPPGVTSGGAQRFQYWHARAGGGGGGGGCPGLAGSPGGGGGASIAILLFDSPIKLEKAEVIAGVGGNGGRGTFGSRPTLGGAGGSAVGGNGAPGGKGGDAGVSGSGAGGPSFAIAHHGAPPTLTASSSRAARAGAGVAEEVSPDQKVLPASPDGESKTNFAF